jgi:hypothetical protein
VTAVLLDELMSEAERFARRHFDPPTRRFLPPTFIGADARGRRVVVIGSWATEMQKVAALAEVRRYFRQHQIIAYGSVTESWISPTLNAELVRRGERMLGDRRPSQMPDRIEYVTVVVTDGIQTKGTMLAMTRDAKGRVCRLERDESFPQGPNAEWCGRMTELLGLWRAE